MQPSSTFLFSGSALSTKLSEETGRKCQRVSVGGAVLPDGPETVVAASLRTLKSSPGRTIKTHPHVITRTVTGRSHIADDGWWSIQSLSVQHHLFYCPRGGVMRSVFGHNKWSTWFDKKAALPPRMGCSAVVNIIWVFKHVIFIQGPRYTSGGPRYTHRGHGTSKSPIPRYA